MKSKIKKRTNLMANINSSQNDTNKISKLLKKEKDKHLKHEKLRN